MSKKLNKILLSLLSILLSCILIEILLQILHYQYYPLHIRVLGGTNYADSQIYQGDWRIEHAFKDNSYVYDPILIWKPNVKYIAEQGNGNNQLFYNSLGFPGPEFDRDNHENKYRIFALGDSNTMGYSYYDEKTGRRGWPALLQQMSDGNYEIINGGLSGYSSYQIYKKYFSILQYKPNAVIVSATTNDAHYVGESDDKYSFINVINTNILFDSKIFQLLQETTDIVKNILHKESTLVPRVSLNQYEKILDELISHAQENNIRLIFITRPFYIYSEDPPTKDMKMYNDILKTKAEKKSIEIVDIQEHIGTQAGLFTDDTHLNAIGLQLLATMLNTLLHTNK